MKKILWVSAMACVAAALVAGCSKKESAAEVKYLVVGMDPQRAPFAVREADGPLLEGFDVELAKVLSEKAGLPLKIEEMASDRLVPALLEGKIDAAMSGLAITEERSRLVDFSAPTYDATPVAVIVAGGIVPETQDELKGMKIGAQAGSKGEAAARTLSPADRVSTYASPVEPAAKLLAGEIECAILDAEQAAHFAKKHPLLMVLGVGFDAETCGVAVRKGDGELRAKANEALAEIAADGRREALVERWIAPSADLPTY